VVLTNPDNIPGLTLWVDAADASTVNNGRVTNGQNVFKIVDKVSGITFRNGYGSFGPSYSVGAVNGKNVITFNYYTQSSIDSIQAKVLWAGNVTTMATGTYSLYCVSFPYDLRKRDTDGANVINFQRLWLLSLINSLPNSLGNYAPNRQIYYFASASQSTFSANNLSPQIREDTDFNALTTGSIVNDRGIGYKDYQNLPLSDSRYSYGKVNILGLRVSNNSTSGPASGTKKFTTIRKDYILKDNFYSRAVLTYGITGSFGFTPASGGGPWLTIGAIIPNASSRVVDGLGGPISVEFAMGVVLVNGSPVTASQVFGFEGHFCELLYFDRTLSDSESNSVEQYLTKKWIG